MCVCVCTLCATGLSFLLAIIINFMVLFNNKFSLLSQTKKPECQTRLKTTAFISLNYDILIDNALTEIHDVIDLDYGIQFTNFEKTDDWHKPRVNRAKLHISQRSRCTHKNLSSG